jgi:branched-chain amino acid transport system permease protein
MNAVLRSLPLARPVVFLAAVAVAAGMPWLGADPFWIRQTVLVVLLGLVVSGLNLTFGYAGELALGQAAVYAAAAFGAGYVAKNHLNDVLVLLVLSAAFAVVVGLLTGAPGLRLGGWMLAIGSFFLVLLIPDVVAIIGEPLGGHEGLSGIPLPVLLGQELTPNGFYVVTVLVAACWFALFRNLVVSPRGAEFRVLGSGEALSSSLGISTYRLKLRAYAVGAVPAGLAGCLFAYLDGYVAASSFGLHATLMILAAGVLGGMHTVYGALLGAALMQLGPMSSSAFEDYSFVVFGLFLLLGGVFLPKGITPLLTRLLRRIGLGTQPSARGRARADREDAGFPPVTGGRLSVEGVTKSFGGVHALSDVALEAEPGQVTALIGPNGSGKTTLLNVISGYYRADAGSVTLDGRPLDGSPAYVRARAGVGRTFQTPTIPDGLTVREAVRTGAVEAEVGLLATVLRLPAYWRREREAGREVDVILAALGIAEREHENAAALPLGTRRLVELGRALASRPAVLLLDEVASGLDREEVAELGQVIRRLRAAGATIVLVEHNFDLIRSVADHVVVLAEGRVLAAGTAAAVAADEQVRRTYLGAGPVQRTARSTAPVATDDVAHAETPGVLR